MFLYYAAFYAFAYYGITIPRAFITGDKTELANKIFWQKSLLFVGATAVVSSFYFQGEIVKMLDSSSERYFMRYILFYLKRPIILLVPLLLIKYFYDRNMPNLYGLSLRKINLKPYLILLGLVLPLIIIASFQPDFMRAYPKFKPWVLKQEIWDLPNWVSGVIFELVYGLDFVFVELLFRGALVIGLASVIGRRAVLPAAVMYVFLHFGKPVGEAVSSFFGGYILGVVALYTRSIFGGVVVHLGVAYSMELAAYLQHIRIMND